MQPGLRGDRAKSAVPVSLASRVSAWAKESLVARALAIAVGLVVLAFVGSSALAGNARVASGVAGDGAAALATKPQVVIPEDPRPVTWVDAGGVAVASSPAQPVTVVQIAPAPQTVSAASSRSRATPDDPVDLNSATVDDLRRLPGVGAKRAEAILALRARLPGGRFRQIEDLLKVKGIGRAMLRRIHPLVRLAAPITDGGTERA